MRITVKFGNGKSRSRAFGESAQQVELPRGAAQIARHLSPRDERESGFEATDMSQHFDRPKLANGLSNGSAPVSAGPAVAEPFDLRQIPVEQVYLRPESRLVYFTD